MLDPADCSRQVLAPFAIGMVVYLAHLVMVPIDGCSINPARTFGTAVTSG
jgi:aquaporin PIP